MIMGIGETMTLADVSWLFDELQPLPEIERQITDLQTSVLHPVSSDSLAGMPLEQLERQAILETLKQTNGNQTRAAKALGISDRTLRDKIKRYRQTLMPV
jgi:DNA-binding NtrC family response regulator